ncbi:bifunctional folylpolyglutamate synthase/dihydrofolate synthase [Flavobacteriaceae bacterium]|nr:bifunctional folylpolyglutamate synthase/dihydrofolate synthase [Flavobacteriaceae bacterium]
MKYNSTIQWMFNKLPVYQNSGAFKYKIDLQNIYDLSTYLGDPHTKLKTIHVGGTNGKGSTSHILSSVLQESGYKVGLYTSPHLKDFRERIKINGDCITKDNVVKFIKSHKEYLEVNKLSFFEMTVGMAFDYFKNQQVDIAIIEVGMGGRLDSTNIIDPEVSVITNIGLDHTKFLGNTLLEIANEKSGIIKKGKTVVIGETQDELAEVFLNKAKQVNSKIVFADQQKQHNYPSDLKGSYQRKNIQTAISAIHELTQSNWNVDIEAIKLGISKVHINTGFTGRWTVLNQSPLTICDTAHNKEGLSIVLKDISSTKYSKLHFVVGFVEDKELDSIIELFPKDAIYYFCKPDIKRGLSAITLKSIFKSHSRIGKSYKSVNDALVSAKENSKEGDLIYVGGSTFVVSEVI